MFLRRAQVVVNSGTGEKYRARFPSRPTSGLCMSCKRDSSSLYDKSPALRTSDVWRPSSPSSEGEVEVKLARQLGKI